MSLINGLILYALSGIGRDICSCNYGECTSTIRLRLAVYWKRAAANAKEFAIANSPAQLPPASLSITAYAPNPIKAVKVLDVDEQEPTNISFHIDLDHGRYYLMATATWSAATSVEDQKSNISGYAIYVWTTNIV
jgi:hypothetical protein